MRVCACHGDVVLRVDTVFCSHIGKSIDYPISDCSIPRLSIHDQVYNSLGGHCGIAHDEGAAIQSLSQAGADLIKISISHEINLDDRSSNVSQVKESMEDRPYPVISALPAPTR